MTRLIDLLCPCDDSQGQMEELAADNRALREKFTAEETRRKELSERCQVDCTCQGSPAACSGSTTLLKVKRVSSCVSITPRIERNRWWKRLNLTKTLKNFLFFFCHLVCFFLDNTDNRLTSYKDLALSLDERRNQIFLNKQNKLVSLDFTRITSCYLIFHKIYGSTPLKEHSYVLQLVVETTLNYQLHIIIAQ